MDALDWNKIFEIAKQHLDAKSKAKKGSGIKRAGTGGAKKVVKKASIEGSGLIYPCWLCRAIGFQGMNRTPKRLQKHLENVHKFNREDAKQVEGAFRKYGQVEARSKEYLESEQNFKQFIPGSDLPFSDLIGMVKKGKANAEQKNILGVISNVVKIDDEKIEEKTDGKDDEEDTKTEEEKTEEKDLIKEMLDELLRKKNKKIRDEERKKKAKEKQDADWEKEIAKAAKPQPGISDIMTLMKKQQGELPPEQKADLAELGKATVKGIKTKSTKSKAAKADKANIDAKLKRLDASKLKRVPSEDIKVKSKIKKGGKAVLVISENDL